MYAGVAFRVKILIAFRAYKGEDQTNPKCTVVELLLVASNMFLGSLE